MSPGNELAEEGADVREVLLEQGKELSERVLYQYERFCRAPFNSEESARLRGLQARFAEWERSANAQCPGLDTHSEFPDSRLRPFHRELSVSDIARLRRTPSILEAHFVSLDSARRAARPVAPKEVDDGIWPSAGPGI